MLVLQTVCWGDRVRGGVCLVVVAPVVVYVGRRGGRDGAGRGRVWQCVFCLCLLNLNGTHSLYYLSLCILFPHIVSLSTVLCVFIRIFSFARYFPVFVYIILMVLSA